MKGAHHSARPVSWQDEFFNLEAAEADGGKRLLEAVGPVSTSAYLVR